MASRPVRASVDSEVRVSIACRSSSSQSSDSGISVYTRQATGREFIWDFDEEARRIRGVIPGLAISASQFERLIASCRNLEREPAAATLVQLTLKS